MGKNRNQIPTCWGIEKEKAYFLLKLMKKSTNQIPT
jgi:hypothetical protein